MDTKVIYSKGGKKNGYIPEEFERPPDWENEYSEEDEVFVDDPRLDKAAATKPLMFPRQRPKVKGRGRYCRCRPVVHAVCCFLFLVLSLGSLMGLVVYFVNKHTSPKHVGGNTFKTNVPKQSVDFSDIVGCDHIEVEDVWVKGFPKLLTESAFRLVDVNQDGVLDIILGFATGADGYRVPRIVCDIYFNGTYPCFGGLLALEGATGEELWRHYAQHEMYGINCNADLNRDGVKDCLSGGRAGAFEAVSGKDGSLIWEFGKQEAKNDVMNLYTAQVTRDLDGDGIEDVLAIHGGDPLQDPGSKYRLSGRIIFFSGKTGSVLRWMGVPDNRESYYSPQIYTLMDGTEMVLFGTGGETHGGSIWRITLDDLYHGKIENAKALYTDKFKGFMTPPVLADVTGDGVEDIIIPAFNSSLLAFNGLTSELIWNQTFPMSESYNTPSAGYYNDDNVPDFLIKYAHGPGFPVYYHSVTAILDGRTGKQLLNPPVRDTVGAQASAITVSMEGRGNDVFLYWAADCHEHEGEGGEFQFVEGTNVHEQSRSDFCHLRFKTKGYTKLYAISQHIPPPGATVYFSEDRTKTEYAAWVNTTAEGIQFIQDHPELLRDYGNYDLPEDAEPQQLERPLEGGEYLFNTPFMGDNQRTSYKKGPLAGSPISGYGQRGDNSLETGGRNLPFSDYDYDSQYYTDPYQEYKDGLYGGLKGYNNGYKSRYGSNRQPYRYRPTTARPPRFRQKGSRAKFPLGKRFTEKKSTDYRIKPNAMKKKRKRDIDLDLEKRLIKSLPDLLRDKETMGSLPPGVYEYWRNLADNNLMDSDKTASNKVPYDEKRKEHTLHSSNFQENREIPIGKEATAKDRKRRHVGPHDEKGLQRLLSTGSLAPTTLPPDHEKYNQSVDFVFATYWFFPAKTRAILPSDQECIKQQLSKETQRFDPDNKYFGLDHDSYEHAITNECLESSGHDLPDEGTYESQTQYDPFNVHMGQMTVYRLRLTCTCSNMTAILAEKKRCGRVLPFDQQQWFAYMGNKADSHWQHRKPFF